MENFCKLSILDCRIWIHLGCSEEEKFHPQLVSFDIDLFFKAIPIGASSDNIEDTICYLKLTEIINNFCQNKRFNLIEYLTYDIYKIIVSSIDQNSLLSLIKVTAKKISPPVPNIHGGVSFTYSGPQVI